MGVIVVTVGAIISIGIHVFHTDESLPKSVEIDVAVLCVDRQRRENVARAVR
ncbi:hypothetical protein ES703_106909 [subsurface metagenome]